LTQDEREKFIKLLWARKDPTERENVRKAIQESCKKVKICPHCESFNGTVKKIVG
jgi:superfamily II helicase